MIDWTPLHPVPIHSLRGLCLLAVVLVFGGDDRSGPAVQAGEPEPAVRPFRIQVDQAVLEDLGRRLRLTRYPNRIADSNWADGTDLGYLKELVRYWQTEYDWRAQEKALNRWSHFKTNIDGMDLHLFR